MNWKKTLCAGLSGALLLGAMAGCGTSDAQPTATPAADDVAYQAIGLPRDTVLFTVDGRDVTADQYLHRQERRLPGRRRRLGGGDRGPAHRRLPEGAGPGDQ